MDTDLNRTFFPFFALEGHYLLKWFLYSTQTEVLKNLCPMPTNLTNISQEACAQKISGQQHHASCDSSRFIAAQSPGQIWLIALNPFL